MQRGWVSITDLESSRKQSWRQDSVVTPGVRAVSPMHWDAGQKGSEGDRAVSQCTAQPQTRRLRGVLTRQAGLLWQGPRPQGHVLTRSILTPYTSPCASGLSGGQIPSLMVGGGGGGGEGERRKEVLLWLC